MNDSSKQQVTTSPSITTTKVPESKVVPLKPSENVTTSSTSSSLAPEIKISNKTGNFSDSAENGPEIQWCVNIKIVEIKILEKFKIFEFKF